MGSQLSRISITLEENVLEQFDAQIKRQGFPTRSEAVKQLIKASLIEQEWKDGEVVAGVITLVYDHHKSRMLDEIIGKQHDFGSLVLCSQHAHLDHHNCMENIIVKGPVEELKKLFHGLETIKGMTHCSLTMTTAGHHF
ncbi:MAG: nickel-responsive transcriptional regulator NikR [Thermoguttaceae bacterium]|nr:nickel-responsive transcriptional regulator NikR [Thermoguttaceae bacterium]